MEKDGVTKRLKEIRRRLKDIKAERAALIEERERLQASEGRAPREMREKGA